jgi:hypothetical protein
MKLKIDENVSSYLWIQFEMENAKGGKGMLI